VPATGKGPAPALGLLLAVFACLAVVGFRAWQHRDVVYDRFHLPAFDGHVYAAMAGATGCSCPGWCTSRPGARTAGSDG
jgi:hypothetical protein